jgi:hypothetical protein
MIAKRKGTIEYSAFRLSSLLSTIGKNNPKEEDFSWLDILTKKGKEEFKRELYNAISEAIKTEKWSEVEYIIDCWRETAEIMSDKDLMKSIEKSKEEIKRGETISWEDIQKELKLK